jgi:hypothetical protein
MTENTAEIVETDISPVMAEYDKWKDVKGVSAVGQALHPAVLNNISWGEGITPRKIAEFTLQTARDETLRWVDDRKGSYNLEQSDYYHKVHEVRREIRKILRKEKA